MAKFKNKEPIEVSSSPEPEPIQKRAQTTRAKPPPNDQVIELTDTDDDRDVPPPRVRPKQPSNALAGPSSRPETRQSSTKLGSSSSVENIPAQHRVLKVTAPRLTPLFLPSDEENNPPAGLAPRSLTPAPFPFQPNGDMVVQPPAPPFELDPIPEPEPVINPEPMFIIDKPGPDPQSTVIARVLEIIPDVEPDYLSAAVTQHMLDHPEQDTATVVEHMLHALFEDNKYPKVDRMGKGKRKQTEPGEDVVAGSQSKKTKIDYADKERPFKGGAHYKDLSLEHLQTSFPFVPKVYLRSVLTSNNNLYAPSHLFLEEQAKTHKCQLDAGETVNLPYRKRSTHYRPKGKGPATRDEELDAERKWVLDHLEGRGDAAEEATGANDEDDDDDGECEDGIQCGCCFSSYRFDKMVQCPETHLFCMSCMRSYASTLLGSHDHNIKCMDQSGCKALIPASELRRFLPEKLMTLYERVKQRKEVEAAGLEGLEECPFCEWGCVIENPDEKLLRCGNLEVCGAVSCRGCKKLDHLPKSCKEMEEDKHLDGRHAVEEAMTQALMRNCPKCQKPFIKESGCNKMSCPNCSTLSCYICRQIINGYEHFNQLPAHMGRTSTSNTPGKCLLWDSVEQRHVDEVKAAAERAQEQYKLDHPDIDDAALKVDLPVAPPVPVNPNTQRIEEHLRNARAEFDRANADLAQLQQEEQRLQASMIQRESDITILMDSSRRMPQMHLEYEHRAYVIRLEVGRERERWYQIRAQVQQTQIRVEVARGQVAAQERALQAYAAVPAFNMHANHMYVAPPPVYHPPAVVRPPVRARVPRRRR